MGSSFYMRKHDGAEESGPFEREALLDALRQGHIRRATQVRRDGGSDWKALEDHPDFFGAPPRSVDAAPSSALAESPAAAPPPAGKQETAAFSWGRALAHYLVFALGTIALSGVVAGLGPNVIKHPNEFSALIGRFVGQSIPGVLLLSFLVQTRRSGWAVAVVLLLFVLPVVSMSVLRARAGLPFP